MYYPIYAVSVASQVQHLLLIFLWEEKKKFYIIHWICSWDFDFLTGAHLQIPSNRPLI